MNDEQETTGIAKEPEEWTLEEFDAEAKAYIRRMLGWELDMLEIDQRADSYQRKTP